MKREKRDMSRSECKTILRGKIGEVRGGIELGQGALYRVPKKTH
jgi:hypothetical protein